MTSVEEHRAVQAIAKEVLRNLSGAITARDTECTIADRATAMLEDRGITETWYHQCPALVLAGARSCLSISGRDYRPSDEPIGSNSLVTIDLSPMRNGVWGDCARSFYVEKGRSAEIPSFAEFVVGRASLQFLHQDLMACARPDTKFSELYRFMNARIAQLDFENLDFLGNLGHSIETSREARRYIDKDTDQIVGSVGLFTFEPHIRKPSGPWGFKHENIYFFSNDARLIEL